MGGYPASRLQRHLKAFQTPSAGYLTSLFAFASVAIHVDGVKSVEWTMGSTSLSACSVSSIAGVTGVCPDSGGDGTGNDGTGCDGGSVGNGGWCFGCGRCFWGGSFSKEVIGVDWTWKWGGLPREIKCVEL